MRISPNTSKPSDLVQQGDVDSVLIDGEYDMLLEKMKSCHEGRGEAPTLEDFSRWKTNAERRIAARAQNLSLEFPPSIYQLLSEKEVTNQMHVTTQELRIKEAADELFSVSGPNGIQDRCFPAFQLDTRLDAAMLKLAVCEFRRAEISTTFLWGVLRTGTKDFDGLNGVEMLLGATTPGTGVMGREPRFKAFQGVIEDAVSRIRWG